MNPQLRRKKRSFRGMSPAANDVHRDHLSTQANHRDDHPDDGLSERYRWMTLIIIVVGRFMVVLDSTIVGVALDPIGRSLHSTADVEWLLHRPLGEGR